jgi:enolase-like protein
MFGLRTGKTKQWLSPGKILIEKLVEGPLAAGPPRTLEASEFIVERIVSREVLDNRGKPTVQVDLYTKNGFGRFPVSSGASKSHLEALELRDGDKQRYHGQGVQRAIESRNTVLGPKIMGLHPRDQRKFTDCSLSWTAPVKRAPLEQTPSLTYL